jgi:hypothetical protein
VAIRHTLEGMPKESFMFGVKAERRAVLRVDADVFDELDRIAPPEWWR